MPSYGERLGGGAVRPRCRGVASSKAKMSYSLEGRFATLERGGDVCSLEGRCATLERVGDVGHSRGVSTGTLERGGDRPAGSRGMRMGRTLGLFESFAFFQAGRRPGPSWAQLS